MATTPTRRELSPIVEITPPPTDTNRMSHFVREPVPKNLAIEGSSQVSENSSAEFVSVENFSVSSIEGPSPEALDKVRFRLHLINNFLTLGEEAIFGMDAKYDKIISCLCRPTYYSLDGRLLSRGSMREVEKLENRYFEKFGLTKHRTRTLRRSPLEEEISANLQGNLEVPPNSLLPPNFLIEKLQQASQIRCFLNSWSVMEGALFTVAMCRVGKDFLAVSRLLKTKSRSECVEFYYQVWKLSRRYFVWNRVYRRS